MELDPAFILPVFGPKGPGHHHGAAGDDDHDGAEQAAVRLERRAARTEAAEGAGASRRGTA